MKLAVFGPTGQVGTELMRRSHAGMEKIAVGRDVADFTDPDSVAAAVRATDADVLINVAAYTAVDRAEEEPETATAINATSVGALGLAAAERGLPVLHVSTDYVFDGTGKEAHAPFDALGPLNEYGRSKLAGEEALRASGATHLILRTSWVFSAHGANFVKTMLRLAGEKTELGIVGDQIGGPTPAAAIADALVALARPMSRAEPGDETGGTYHFSGAPDVSWADFAREIFQMAEKDVTVDDITTASYPTPARRPFNSRLDCDSLARDFQIARPDWRVWLDDVLKELA